VVGLAGNEIEEQELRVNEYININEY